MDDTLYRLLKYIAIVMTLAWLGWASYDSLSGKAQPGESAYQAGERYFEDGRYTQAVREFNQALSENPQFLPAKRALARSLMQIGEFEQALSLFNQVIKTEPAFPASYANRGILHDRMGHYRQAIADYEHAIKLDAEISEGPNWLTRFLRLQADKPPSIADRARYLRQQLAKPEAERILKVKEQDDKQRSYKM